jgi:serine/threonine protein phosphatase 1
MIRDWLRLRESNATPLFLNELSRLTLDPMPAAVYAVGDLHGRLDLYLKLENLIVEDARLASDPKLVVLLGDVIDRGPQSAALVDHLIAPPPDGLQRLVLRGNHEDMFLKFCNDPARHRNWIDYGGSATLSSYGAKASNDRGFDLPAKRMLQIIAAYIPPSHLEFLRSLPISLTTGRYFLCHASIDPRRPLAEQSQHDLLFGDPARIDSHDLPFTVVHGHVAVPEPIITTARIAIDTRAWHSGILTAVRLTHDEPPAILSAGI